MDLLSAIAQEHGVIRIFNSIHPWRSAAMCPMTTHKAVQFSQEDRVIFGITSPVCLTVNQVIPCNGNFLVDSLKRARRNYLSKVSSTGRDASPMCRVMHWTKYHSFWRDF